MSTAKQQARDLVEKAGTTIQAGDPRLALEYLRQSILYNPKDAEAYILLGVALAQTDKPFDAENAFIKATKTDPNNVKAFYNLAVHLYAQEMPRKAFDKVQTALTLDPTHKGSIELDKRLRSELGDKVPVNDGTPQPQEIGKYERVPEERPGYEEAEAENLPFIRAMGPVWTGIGLSIALLSLTGLLMALGAFRPYYAGGNLSKTTLDALQASPTFKLLQAVHICSVLGGLSWVIFDLIHRRGNLLWILPQGICGMVGFTWVILPLYIFTGRTKSQKTPAQAL